MKLFRRTVMAVCAVIAAFGAHAANYAWPAKYEGVMLQGFSWDSYTDTKWTNLESQADELSQYFKLIWIPNSGYCGGSNNMGYMPQYWFTNHNSSFGTEAELRSMIKTFKEKGTGFIADVVINHRNGVTNWTDFPAEKWNGKTWKIGPEGICSTDEVKDAAGQAKPTGAPDTGEDFNGARDLDHTNANVQENCKNYCKFLLEDLGYAGFRYDMVKGYSGQYNKIYNEYSKPTFSVGEYWDGSYDAVAGWIDATGKQSAAFDFPCKYAINKAFSSNDMTELVWKANGTTPQPAGMIHFGYPQYAVTFVDNHDTYRDGSKFTDSRVVAANAFILFSPGTPCIFLPHWKMYKAELKKLINLRNAVGIHNMSAVRVLSQSSSSCYMAEITGTKGKAVVKIGPAQVSPDGYTDADIKASGKDYCVWTKVNGGGDDPVIPGGDDFMVYFDNSTERWATPTIHYWGSAESAWPGVAMTKVDGNVWGYKVPAGTTGCLFNAGDGDNTKTGDMTATANHIYDRSGDKGVYNGQDIPGGDYPAKLYLVGTVNSKVWDVPSAIEQTSVSDGVYTWNGIKIDEAVDKSGKGSGKGYFTFLTKRGADWDEANGGDRYGAVSEDVPLVYEVPAEIKLFPANVSASSAYSWCAEPGTYTVEANLKDMKVTLRGVTSISGIGIDGDVTPVYYTLQGVRVDSPTQGLYIVKRGDKVTKEYVR